MSEHDMFMLETHCVICWLGPVYLGSKNIVFRPLVVGHLLLKGGFWAAIHWCLSDYVYVRKPKWLK